MKRSIALFAACLLSAAVMGVILSPDDETLYGYFPEITNATGAKVSGWDKLVATVILEHRLDRSMEQSIEPGAWQRLLGTVQFWRLPEVQPLSTARYQPPRSAGRTVVVADRLNSKGELPFCTLVRSSANQENKRAGTFNIQTRTVVNYR
ncbi:MAG: hypothetical protein R3F19_10785 [Verrucomicrobiales bacterium]